VVVSLSNGAHCVKALALGKKDSLHRLCRVGALAKRELIWDRLVAIRAIKIPACDEDRKVRVRWLSLEEVALNNRREAIWLMGQFSRLDQSIAFAEQTRDTYTIALELGAKEAQVAFDIPFVALHARVRTHFVSLAEAGVSPGEWRDWNRFFDRADTESEAEWPNAAD
jgi:hypothetical protein